MPAPSPQIAPDTAPLDVPRLVAAGFATVVHRSAVASTMDAARALADDPATPLPAVVVADRQEAGPRPTWALACGVALAETLRAIEPQVAALVRWPNDVEAAGRKLAGILVETAAHGRAVVGIGVNTSGTAAAAPAPIRHRVGTLPDLTGRPFDRTVLLAEFLPRCVELIAALERDPEALLDRYRPLCALDGTVVTVHSAAARHAGVCRGIARSGALVVDTPTGRREFSSGSLADPADVWPGPAGS